MNLVLDPHKGVAVVLLALLLWLGWLWAAPPPLLLGVLRPIPLRVGVVCGSSSFCGREVVGGVEFEPLYS